MPQTRVPTTEEWTRVSQPALARAGCGNWYNNYYCSLLLLLLLLLLP
jgi:hypothetical protein